MKPWEDLSHIKELLEMSNLPALNPGFEHEFLSKLLHGKKELV